MDGKIHIRESQLLWSNLTEVKYLFASISLAAKKWNSTVKFGAHEWHVFWDHFKSLLSFFGRNLLLLPQCIASLNQFRQRMKCRNTSCSLDKCARWKRRRRRCLYFKDVIEFRSAPYDVSLYAKHVQTNWAEMFRLLHQIFLCSFLIVRFNWICFDNWFLRKWAGPAPSILLHRK